MAILGLRASVALAASIPFALFSSACLDKIDPGPNFTTSNVAVDPNVFYCQLEQQVIVGRKCGAGDPAQGDKVGGCHFNAGAVTGMVLIDHPPVDCADGGSPLLPSSVDPSTSAAYNFRSVAAQTSIDPALAPLIVRPLGKYHPRVIFAPTDPDVIALEGWMAQ